MLTQKAIFSYGRIALKSIINDIKEKNKKEKLIAYLQDIFVVMFILNF